MSLIDTHYLEQLHTKIKIIDKVETFSQLSIKKSITKYQTL